MWNNHPAKTSKQGEQQPKKPTNFYNSIWKCENININNTNDNDNCNNNNSNDKILKQRQLQKHFARMCFFDKHIQEIYSIPHFNQIVASHRDKTDPKKSWSFLFKWWLTTHGENLCDLEHLTRWWRYADCDTNIGKTNREKNNNRSELKPRFFPILGYLFVGGWTQPIWLFNFEQHFHFVFVRSLSLRWKQTSIFSFFLGTLTILSNSI